MKDFKKNSKANKKFTYNNKRRKLNSNKLIHKKLKAITKKYNDCKRIIRCLKHEIKMNGKNTI